jgi:hypothetical protein
MLNWHDIDDAIPASEINNPLFLEHVRQVFPKERIIPDEEDFDLFEDTSTYERVKKAHRHAQARTLVRMFREWRAAQN